MSLQWLALYKVLNHVIFPAHNFQNDVCFMESESKKFFRKTFRQQDNPLNACTSNPHCLFVIPVKNVIWHYPD